MFNNFGLIYTKNLRNRIYYMFLMFANGPADLGSILGRVISKTQMVLSASLLNTLHYTVQIKGKVEQSSKWSSVFHYTSE